MTSLLDRIFGAEAAADAAIERRERIVQEAAIESSRRGDGSFLDGEEVPLEFMHSCGYAWDAHDWRPTPPRCPDENEARALYGNR